MKNTKISNGAGNQRGFLSIILTIVVAMVLMSGAAFVWYKSDMGKEVKQEASTAIKKDAIEEEKKEISEEDNWKSYTDNDFGISFEYPNDDYELEVSVDKITISQEHLDFEIYITKFNKDVELNKEKVVYNRSVEVINNLTYREFWRQGMGNRYGYVLHDENFGTYYIFESTTGPDNETFEEIIKTVSLAKVIPPGPVEDWANYKSEDAKIGFYYTTDFVHTQDSELFGKLYKSDEGHFWVKVGDDKGLKTIEEIKTDYHANDMYGYSYEESFVNIRGIDIYKQGRYDLGVIEKYYFLSNTKLVTISFEFNFDKKDEVKQKEFKSLIASIINTISLSEVSVKQNDLQTYTNEEWNISFEYPSEWDTLSEAPIGIAPNYFGYSVSVGAEALEVDQRSRPSFSVTVGGDGAGPYFPNKRLTLQKSEQGFVVVNSVDIEPHDNQDKGTYFIMASNNDNVDNLDYFRLSFHATAGDNDKWDLILEDILKSFNFLP